MSSRRRLAGAVSKHGLLIVASAIALFPVYVMITAAFKTQASFLAHPWAPIADPTLAGYRAALGDQFPRWLGNTVAALVRIGRRDAARRSARGLGLRALDFWARDVVLGLLVALMVVPPVVLLVPLFVFGVRIGQISTFRLVILIYVGLMLPFSVYMLTNFFRTIPASMIEAAVIDGCSSWRVFRRIVLPLSAAPLVTLGVVNLLWVWNELLIALVFLQDDSKKTLMVGITGFQSRYSLNVPAIMAGLTLATLPIITVYIFGQRFFVRGLVAGALKGE